MDDPLASAMRIRRRVSAVYNKRREDFACENEYNDFLELREDAIFNLTEGVAVAETEKALAAYEREHAEEIAERAARELEEAREAAAAQATADAAPRRMSGVEEEAAAAGPVAGLVGDAAKGPAGPGVVRAAPPPPLAPATAEERRQRERDAARAGGFHVEFWRRRSMEAALGSLVV